jgi:Ser/Thr protein kinase RdoA (MazF antagonist)
MLFSGITSAVTATWASLSSLPDVIRQAYGIADARLTPLAGGYSNELWRAGELVVRVESAPPESVAWEHALVRFLSARVEEVVAPVETVEGATFVDPDGCVLSAWPYVDGSSLARLGG